MSIVEAKMKDDEYMREILSNETYLNRARQIYQCIQNRPNLQKQCKDAGFRGALAGGAIGVVGAVIYNIVEMVISPIFWALSIIFSVIVGGVIGSVTWTAKQFFYEIPKDKAFIEWKIQANRDNVYHIFLSKIMNDEEMKSFICPIDDDLIVDPVEDECGHCYERIAIYEWIETKEFKGEVCMCPMGGDKLITKENLKDSFSYKKNLASKISEYYDGYHRRGVVDQEIRKGARAYLQTFLKETDEIYKKENIILTNALKRGAVGVPTHSTRMEELLNYQKDIQYIRSIFDCLCCGSVEKEKNIKLV
jgi:hypothetical protein